MAKPVVKYSVYTLVANGKTAWVAKQPKVLIEAAESWNIQNQVFMVTEGDWTNNVLCTGNKDAVISFLKTL